MEAGRLTRRWRGPWTRVVVVGMVQRKQWGGDRKPREQWVEQSCVWGAWEGGWAGGRNLEEWRPVPTFSLPPSLSGGGLNHVPHSLDPCVYR